MYAWSRNLWTPIFAHFVNNATTLLMVYLSNQQLIAVDVENPESSITWTGALMSLVLTAVLLLNLKIISHRKAV
jgi:membrane protease YdiL (CAAX protease family)